MYKYLDRDDDFPKPLKERRLAKSLLLPIFFLLVTQSAAQSTVPDHNHLITLKPDTSAVTSALAGCSGMDSLNLAQGIGRSRFFAGGLIANRGPGQSLNIETKGGSLFGLESVLHDFPQRGGYLGISQTFYGGRGVDLVGEAWFLVPEDTAVAHSNYRFTGGPGHLSSRSWQNTEAAGCYIDAAVLFSWVPGWRKAGWSQINGLRYDYYSRRLKNPGILNAPPSPLLISSPSDVVEVNAGSWIPYIGLQSEYNGSGGRGTFRSLVGIVISQLSHKETWGAIARKDELSITGNGSSFFFEIFGDYTWHLSRHTDLGFFVKGYTIDEHADGHLESSVGGGAVEGISCNLYYRKILYVFGAELSTAFDLPF
jgi:hypothetical protein